MTYHTVMIAYYSIMIKGMTCSNGLHMNLLLFTLYLETLDYMLARI